MKYLVEVNYIQVIGNIWMPNTQAAYEYKLTDYDIKNIGKLTRENIDLWLCTNAGDFQSIDDFSANIKDTEISWNAEESEFAYSDLMYPCEDD